MSKIYRKIANLYNISNMIVLSSTSFLTAVGAFYRPTAVKRCGITINCVAYTGGHADFAHKSELT